MPGQGSPDHRIRASTYSERKGEKMAKELLRMEGITKIYPNGVVANKDVDFSG